MHRSLHTYNHLQTQSRHTGESKVIAMHEAGHAAAIYFGNREKELPPVLFRIIIDRLPNERRHTVQNQCSARIEGGKLIQTLPASFETVATEFTAEEKYTYARAFEADILNMLVGPLAEAKFVVLRDGETMNRHLVNLDALHRYGGFTDLKHVYDYLQSLYENSEDRKRKLSELFSAAFDFISNRRYWLAIETLAEHLLAAEKTVMEYTDIAIVLEKSIQQNNSFPHTVKGEFTHRSHPVLANWVPGRYSA